MVLILLSWSLQFRRLPISKFKIGDEKNGDIDMAGRDGIPVKYQLLISSLLLAILST